MDFKDLPPDIEQSKYRHVAYFFNGNSQTGYSKKQGIPEQTDKRKLFYQVCGRLAAYYFTKDVFKVDFYMRVFKRVGGGVNDFSHEVLVATLYDSDFELYGHFQNDAEVATFLKSFYESGFKNAKDIIKSVKRVFKHEYSWDASQGDFEAFRAYCGHLVDIGHERPMVERFFFAIKRRYYSEPAAPTTAAQMSPTAAPARGGDPKSLANLINIPPKP